MSPKSAKTKPEGLIGRSVAMALVFWRGFTTPTRFAFLLTISVTTLTIALLMAFITPSLIAGPTGAYLAHGSQDAEVFATRKALQLSLGMYDSDPAPRLYLLGDSTLAHIVVSESKMQQDLVSVTGHPWSLHIMATGRQGPIDEAAFADYATRRRAGIVVLSTGNERFSDGIKDDLDVVDTYRTGIRSDWGDDVVTALGGKPKFKVGNYAFDNAIFLSRNTTMILKNKLAGKIVEQRIDSFLLHPVPPSQMEHRRQIVVHQMRLGVHPDQRRLDIIAQTVRKLQARGNRVVLVQYPMSRIMRETEADEQAFAAFKAQSRKFAESLGTTYCSLDLAQVSDPRLYPDHYHLGFPEAQQLVRRTLAACIKQTEQKAANHD